MSELFIRKILNNSAAIVSDEKNDEYLVMGKGIAFNKSQYDNIKQTSEMQIFALDNPSSKNRLEHMAAEIPYDYFEITKQIIIDAEKQLKCKFDQNATIRLADHLHYAVQKEEKGIETPNLILGELQRFYPEEFSLSRKALDMINNRLHTHLDINEAGFVAFHLIEGENKDAQVDVNDMVSVLNELVSMIEAYFNIKLDESSVEYSRLITHLKFFILRMRIGDASAHKSLSGDSLYEMLMSHYPDIDRFLDQLSEETSRKYNFSLRDTDRMYLLIHLARILK